jgi:hypothetical protein
LIALLTTIRNEKWGWTGLWLALMLIKPNITLIPVVVIIIWLFRRGKWRPIKTMVFILTGLLLVSTAITPNWYQPFLKAGFGNGLGYTLDGPNNIVGVRINTTLMDWLSIYGFTRTWQIVFNIIAAFIGGFLILLVLLRSKSLLKTVIVSLLVNFVVTPYALQYDYPLLTLPLFWATALFTHFRKAKWVGWVLHGLIASVLIWERPISDGFWIVIGLVVLSAWSWAQTNQLSIPEELL